MTPNLYEVLISRGDRSCEIYFLNHRQTIAARSFQLYLLICLCKMYVQYLYLQFL